MEKVENEVEKEKLVNLGRYVNFLKQFEKKLNNYQRVTIDSYLFVDTVENTISGRSIGFLGAEIKNRYYDICDILIKLADYDIISYYESDNRISFDFYDKSDSNYKKYICLTCFKKKYK